MPKIIITIEKRAFDRFIEESGGTEMPRKRLKECSMKEKKLDQQKYHSKSEIR